MWSQKLGTRPLDSVISVIDQLMIVCRSGWEAINSPLVGGSVNLSQVHCLPVGSLFCWPKLQAKWLPNIDISHGSRDPQSPPPLLLGRSWASNRNNIVINQTLNGILRSSRALVGIRWKRAALVWQLPPLQPLQPNVASRCPKSRKHGKCKKFKFTFRLAVNTHTPGLHLNSLYRTLPTKRPLVGCDFDAQIA